MRLVCLCLMLLCPVVCLAQVTSEVATGSVVEDASQFQLFGEYLLVPDKAELRTKPAACIKLNGIDDGSRVAVEAENRDWDLIPVVDVGSNTYLVVGTGKIRFRATVFNAETGLFDIELVALNLKEPDQPEPDEPDQPDNPSPTPDDSIPEDAFDNLGRRVNQWVSGLPGRKIMATAYKQAASTLRTDPGATIDSASQALVDSLKQSPDFGAYSEVWKQINADLDKRWPMSRGLMADFYDVIAIGMEAGQ